MTDENTRREFVEAVNMTAGQLRDWLETYESRDVGQKSGGAESTGHESGRRIVDILERETPDLDGEDHEQMKRTVSYVHRHLANARTATSPAPAGGTP